MFNIDIDQTKKLLNEYCTLKEELLRILSIIYRHSKSITDIDLNGDVFDVSYEYYCGEWDNADTTIPFSLIGKTEAEIREYIAEQKRIEKEKDRIEQEEAKKKSEEQTRQKELAELARLNAKYNPQTEINGSSI